MAQLSFICHSSQDYEITNQIVEKLEKAGIPCWIAPRNIEPGLAYAASIINGIKNSRFFIVVFTKASNDSDAVINEIENASSLKIKIIPFKIHNIAYADSLEYYLKSKHAINAYNKPLNESINELIGYLQPKTDNLNPPGPPGPARKKIPFLKYGLVALGVILLTFLAIKFGGGNGSTQIGTPGEGTAKEVGNPTDKTPGGNNGGDEKCQPENIDFPNGNNTIFKADFTTLGSQKNEYGNVQPSQFGNAYEMEAYSNTWIGFPPPLYYINLNRPLDNDFIFDMWFKIRDGEPTIQLTLSDDGVNYSNYEFSLEVFDRNNPTYSADEGYIKNNFGGVSKQFAERKKIPNCFVSKINWAEMNHIAIKRVGETVKYFLNNYLLQTFQASSFPIKK